MAQGPHPGFILGELAERFGGALIGGDPAARVARPAPAGEADPDAFAFARDRRFAERAATHPVGLLLAPRGTGPLTFPVLEVDAPELVFYHLVAEIARPVEAPAGVHPTAVVSPEATIHPTAHVGPLAIVEGDAEIGPGARVHAGAYVGPGCRLAEASVVLPRAVLLQDVVLGARSVVYPGAVLGADGFGFAPVGERLVKKPHAGRVEIGPDAEIGANATVDRAVAGATVVEEGVKLDNLVQVGHGARIGAHSVLAALTGVGGSARIGRWNVLGGQVGVADHAETADRVHLGGQSGVVDAGVPEPGMYFGTPPLPRRRAFRVIAAQNELPELVRRVRALEEGAGS